MSPDKLPSANAILVLTPDLSLHHADPVLLQRLGQKYIADIDVYTEQGAVPLITHISDMLTHGTSDGKVRLLHRDGSARESDIHCVRTRSPELIILSFSFLSLPLPPTHHDIKTDDLVSRTLIGHTRPMRALHRLTRQAAESTVTVLITGESGTGKELVANAVHKLSDRANGPMITVNCSALSESLLESELFGHIQGSFTGAVRDKTGKFEAARGGTIFLDEIGEISQLLQRKLLRVLQEKKITRVGDNHETPVNIRIIAATNRDLHALVRDGRFREDLFYRLNVFPIRTVPLREHAGDIPRLVAHFIRRFNTEYDRRVRGVTENARRLLMDYCWPGNVRELENCIEHAFVLTGGEWIDLFDLPQDLRKVDYRDRVCRDVTPHTPDTAAPSAKRRHLRREDVMDALEQSGGNKALAARRLGVSRVGLWKALKRWGAA